MSSSGNGLDTTQQVIIIVSSVVGGILVITLLGLFVVFLLRRNGCLCQSKSSTTEEEERAEHIPRDVHIHTVCDDQNCCNHYPEWLYRELTQELLEAQKMNAVVPIMSKPAGGARKQFTNNGFVEFSEEDNSIPNRIIAYEQDIERLEPVTNPTIVVPYYKKEKRIEKGKPKSELARILVPRKFVPAPPLIEEKPTKKTLKVFTVDDFDPLELQKDESDHDDEKEQIRIVIPKDLNVEPLVKPDKSQLLNYENPKKQSRMRKQQALEEEKRKAEAQKRKSKRVAIPKKEVEIPPLEIEVPRSYEPKKRIMMGTSNEISSSKDNVQLDSFLF